MAVTFYYNESKIQIFKICRTPITGTIQMHSHAKNGYEIHLIDGGYGTLDTAEGKYNLSKNTIYVTGPNIKHKQTPDFENPMQELCIYLEIPKSKKSDRAFDLFTSKPFWIGKSNAAIRHIFKVMLEEAESDEFLKESILSSLTIRLIVEMTRLYYPAETSPVDLLQSNDLNEGRSWILDQLLLEDCSNVTLNDFAEKMGVCPRQAERIIKVYYGSSFKKLRYEAKMAMAATLLEQGNVSIEKCSIQCGYTSVNAFSAAFKKKFEVTPKAYQKLYKSKLSL